MFRFREVCGRPLGKKAVETLHSRYVSLYLSSARSVKRRVGRANELGARRYSIFEFATAGPAPRCHRWKRCLSMQFQSPEQCKMDQLAQKKPICLASSHSIQFAEARQALLQLYQGLEQIAVLLYAL
jgi:hypothetical protein